MTGLLFKRECSVADGIVFKIHTLEEILDFGEQEYYSAISSFLAAPSDYMWELYEQGIDYERISGFELFIALRSALPQETIEFLFGDTLPLHRMLPAQNVDTDEIVLMDPENQECQFNERSLMALASIIRTIHYIAVPDPVVAGNKEAKKYLLELARKKARRAKLRRKKQEFLEPLIIALVNAPEFPYDYTSCRQVTIYQFMSSVNKIPKRLSWNFIMHGIHVGMIDAKKMDLNELNWLS